MRYFVKFKPTLAKIPDIKAMRDLFRDPKDDYSILGLTAAKNLVETIYSATSDKIIKVYISKEQMFALLWNKNVEFRDIFGVGWTFHSVGAEKPDTNPIEVILNFDAA